MSKHILEKRRFVESLTPGMEVSDLFLIAVAQQAQAKNGPYWRLEFRDAHGSISGKIWSPQSQNYPEISTGIALVTGRVTSYRDQPEIAVESIRPLSVEESAGLDLSLFMPAAARTPQDMLEELGRLAVGALSYEPWKRFVAAVLADPEIARALPVAPAAKAMHHAYVGGLLEHTLSVCGLCMRLSDHYPALDRQTLFAGALCHDLGKIWELSPGLVADYTTQGRLIGHISIALEHLAPLMREAGLEPEHADHLRHLILSHHGTREFGSPVLPATAEALALHYADNLDAKLNQVEATLNAALGEAEMGWSAYVPALERTLYRALKTPEFEGPTEAEPDFEFGPLLYDDRLCEEFDPNFHLNNVSNFPEFLFDDSDTLPEKVFLPAETSATSKTPSLAVTEAPTTKATLPDDEAPKAGEVESDSPAADKQKNSAAEVAAAPETETEPKDSPASEVEKTFKPTPTPAGATAFAAPVDAPAFSEPEREPSAPAGSSDPAPVQTVADSPQAVPTKVPPAREKKSKSSRASRAKANAAAQSPEVKSAAASPAEAKQEETPLEERPAADPATPSEARDSSATEAPIPSTAQAEAPASSDSGEEAPIPHAPKKKPPVKKISEPLSLLG